MNPISKHSVLKKRSQFLKQVRAFFYVRDLIEVDTPMLSQGAVPDVHLRSLQTKVLVPGKSDLQTYYLHTSPEYPMKRLLCEGCGDIFYLGKVFRDGDLSPRHQVEFAMLEWYRLGFTMFDLMEEVVDLIQKVLHPQGHFEQGGASKLNVEQLSYQQAFNKYAGIEDIFGASAEVCRDCLVQNNIPEIVGVDADDKVLWEQLVLTEVIEPQLGVVDGQPAISLIYHFPASQASLAQIPADNPLVAERFEVFVNGMELANGYHELADSELYRQRFEASLAEREDFGFDSVPLDENLLKTLADKPLPDCSGVALGVDRLFALQQGFSTIDEGIGFGLLES
ncbi:MAG: elongation factor P--(R)-beta-lysine ligase [Thiomicrorhabdus sp.]|nr:MAG: elongation factor P--(R)-beta-lysine ligase [Thiomicrorhabdus sp.]